VYNVSKNYEPYFSEENLKKTVNDETYAMIESSVSSEERTESMENEKFASLGELLANYGLPHRPIIGSYQGTLSKYSFFVVKPEDVDLKQFRKIIFELGEKYKQESIILSLKGRVELVFTTGEHVGTAWVGKGFNSNIGDNYSKIHTSEGKDYFIGEYSLDRQTYSKWSV
jgi:hypothetical protein